MSGENGLTATSWFWVTTPRATAGLHANRGVIDIAPPYFKFLIGKTIEQAIQTLCRTKETKFIKMRNDDDQENRSRYS